MGKWKVGVYISLALIGLVALQFTLNIAGLEWYRFFGEYQRNVERDIYENNKSFVDSKLDTLSDRWLEYKQANSSNKQSICKATLMEFQDFDPIKVKNNELRRWLKNIQRSGC